MARMGKPEDKGCIGLELSTAGKDDDVFQKTQRARLASILVIDFAIDMICIGELD